MSLDTRIARARQQARVKELVSQPRKFYEIQCVRDEAGNVVDVKPIPKPVFVPTNALGKVNVLLVKDAVHHNVMCCVHRKHYFTPCVACGRDAKRAQQHYDNFIARIEREKAKQ